MRQPFFEIVFITYGALGVPHLAPILEANPRVPYHVGTLEALDGRERLDAWRNADVAIRSWWQAFGHLVETDHVLFLEADVYANCDLTELLDGAWKDADLVAANVLYQVTHRRSWKAFEEADSLPEEMRQLAIGIEPLAALLMRREGLDKICQSRFDGVFSKDIFCELRLPTVVRFAGGSVGFCPRLKGVSVRPVTPPSGERGIWHPVKGTLPE